jgi:hypothetical protein
MFSIWTPLSDTRPDTSEGSKPAGEEDGKAVLPPMTKDQTRWLLGPKESKKLYIKFFSTQSGNYNQTLKFEIVGSPKAFDLNLVASCELPTIN